MLIDVGGITKVLQATLTVVAIILSNPFRYLDLALNLRQMQIFHGSELFKDKAKSDTEWYKSQLSILFYFKFWFRKMYD